MLFGLKSPLEAKESFSLTLHFQSGSKQTVQFLVKIENSTSNRKSYV